MPPIPSKYAWARQVAPASSHKVTPGGYLRYVFPQLFLGVLFLCFAAAGFFAPWQGGPVAGIIIGAVSLPLAIGCFIWAPIRASKIIPEVDVYPEGVLWLKGVEYEGLTWNEITEFYRSDYTVNGVTQSRNIVLKTAPGALVVFEHALTDYENLANSVQQETTLCLAPSALEKFHAGETITFGEMTINTQGITVDKTFFRFEDIETIQIDNGALIVLPEGKPKTERKAGYLGLTPNYLVFLKLLEESNAPRVQVLS
jgi:hypothetical protein